MGGVYTTAFKVKNKSTSASRLPWSSGYRWSVDLRIFPLATCLTPQCFLCFWSENCFADYSGTAQSRSYADTPQSGRFLLFCFLGLSLCVLLPQATPGFSLPYVQLSGDFLTSGLSPNFQYKEARPLTGSVLYGAVTICSVVDTLSR